MNTIPQQAQNIIDKLELKKSYEGIYINRFFESSEKHNARPLASSAYAVCTYGAPSFLHRLDCDELWHFYAGNTLTIYFFEENDIKMKKLGPNIDSGELPSIIIPKNTIFGATVKNIDNWCFFGCTCIPAFIMENCEFISADNPVIKNFKIKNYTLIKKLTNFT